MEKLSVFAAVGLSMALSVVAVRALSNEAGPEQEILGLRAKIVKLEADGRDVQRQATVCAAQLAIATAETERSAATQALDRAALAMGCGNAAGVNWSAQPVPTCLKDRVVHDSSDAKDK